MQKPGFDKIREPVLLVLLAAIVFLPLLGSETGYSIKGEYRWTLPSVVETYSSEDWLVPKLDGMPRLRKPPVFYWFMVGSCRAFGLTLFWARFPTLITGVLAVLLFYYFLAAFNLERKERFAGAVMLMGSWGCYVYSRSAALEVPMLLFTLGAFYGAALLFLKENPSGIVIAAVSAGATLMTKSHATFVSLVIFTLAWTALYGKWRLIAKYRRHWITGAVLFCAIVFPWYIYVYAKYKGVFLETMRKELIEERVTEHHAHYFRMVAGLLSLVIPYTLLLIPAVIRAVKVKSRESLFLAGAVIACVLPYAFVNSHRLRYMVPVIPLFIAFLVFNYYINLTGYGAAMKITAVLAAGFGIAASWVSWKIGAVSALMALAGLAVSLVTAVYYFRNNLMYSALCTAALTLLFIGVFYARIGIGGVGEELVKSVGNAEYATFDREPYYLAVKLGRPPAIDVYDAGSFKRAAEKGLLIYVPGKEKDRLKEFMDSAGYGGYKVHAGMRRFSEYPGKKQKREALLSLDPGRMKEDSMFIGELR